MTAACKMLLPCGSFRGHLKCGWFIITNTSSTFAFHAAICSKDKFLESFRFGPCLYRWVSYSEMSTAPFLVARKMYGGMGMLIVPSGVCCVKKLCVGSSGLLPAFPSLWVLLFLLITPPFPRVFLVTCDLRFSYVTQLLWLCVLSLCFSVT